MRPPIEWAATYNAQTIESEDPYRFEGTSDELWSVPSGLPRIRSRDPLSARAAVADLVLGDISVKTGSRVSRAFAEVVEGIVGGVVLSQIARQRDSAANPAVGASQSFSR